MLRPLPTCIARAKNKNKNKSKNCPCRRDYITRELCCITQEIKNPTIDSAILRREYAGCYQLLCSIMYSKEGQYLDGCLQGVFWWPRKRKRSLWHRGRRYRNPSLRSKRFRRPRVFRTFVAFFAFWPRENWGEHKRSGKRGRRREGRKRLPGKAHDFEKSVRQRTSIKSGKLIWAWPTSTQLTVSLQLENFDVQVWL